MPSAGNFLNFRHRQIRVEPSFNVTLGDDERHLERIVLAVMHLAHQLVRSDGYHRVGFYRFSGVRIRPTAPQAADREYFITRHTGVIRDF